MNNIYKQLVKDIENEKKDYVKRQLTLLKEDIDNLFKLDGISKTVEDTLIVISNFEENVKIMIRGTSDEGMVKDLNKIENYMNQYFKLMDYDGDKVKNNVLSNGMYYEDIEKEVHLLNKMRILRNPLSLVFKILAIILWICTGATFFAYISDATTLAITYLVGGIISGLSLYGFAEIIQLLHDIRRKIYKENK